MPVTSRDVADTFRSCRICVDTKRSTEATKVKPRARTRSSCDFSGIIRRVVAVPHSFIFTAFCVVVGFLISCTFSLNIIAPALWGAPIPVQHLSFIAGTGFVLFPKFDTPELFHARMGHRGDLFGCLMTIECLMSRARYDGALLLVFFWFSASRRRELAVLSPGPIAGDSQPDSVRRWELNLTACHLPYCAACGEAVQCSAFV